MWLVSRWLVTRISSFLNWQLQILHELESTLLDDEDSLWDFILFKDNLIFLELHLAHRLHERDHFTICHALERGLKLQKINANSLYFIANAPKRFLIVFARKCRKFDRCVSLDGYLLHGPLVHGLLAK